MPTFSILVKTTNIAGLSLAEGVERAATNIKPIEFEPNRRVTLRGESGDEFMEELV
jgi:hypothetical protein